MIPTLTGSDAVCNPAQAGKHAGCTRFQAGTTRHTSTERTVQSARNDRAFWLSQARLHLSHARDWRLRFGSYADRTARQWHDVEVRIALLYRRWAHAATRPS